MTPSSQLEIQNAAGNLSAIEMAGPDLPVVFIHGLGGSKEIWSKQLEHLRSRHRAVAIDLRGHGKSPVPLNGDFSVASMAKDIGKLADQNGVTCFVLIGHSMGGYVAIEYADQHPERVAGLLLADCSGDNRRMPKQEKGDFRAQLSDPRQREKAFEGMLLNSKKSTRKGVLKQLKTTPQQTFEKFSAELFTYDPVAPLKRYHGPKLAIYAPANENAYALQNKIPSLPRQRMDKVSHWIMRDNPAAFNQLMDEFLAKIEKQKS